MGLKGVNLKVFLVVLMAVYATAVVVTIIDDFTPNTLPLSVQNIANTDTTSKIRSSNGNATLGTERDQILTILPGTSNKVISSSIVAGQWSNAFLQDTEGWSIVQYDGFDNSSSLSLNPGINPDGSGVDLSFSNSAYAFYFLVTSDLRAYYQINVYGSSLAEVSSYAFIYDPLTYVDPIDEIIIPFADFVGTASFTNVHAIELVLNVTVGTVKEPVDTAILLFGIFGYQVTGTVFFDCNNNAVFDLSEVGISGATVTLFDINNNPITTTTTGATGTFAFRGLTNSTYRACVSNPGGGAVATIPLGTGSCYNNLVLQNGDDATGLLYGFSVTTAISAPPDVDVTCGSCTTTACLGDATAVGCGGTPTVSHTDQTTGTCPQVITRTFTAPGATSVQQIIRVTDTDAPTLTTPPSPVSVACSNKTPSLATWNSTHAGAVAVDTCSAVVWSSNFTGGAAPNCGVITVQFNAADSCANVLSFVSTYTVTDVTPPTFTKLPTSSSAQCDTTGNTDQAAYNTWLTNRASATATDDCASSAALIWSNNSPGVIAHGCNVVQPVTFSVNDGCGNIISASATFTVSDTRAPTITTQASPQTISCSGDVNAAFQSWITTRGGAQATDNCASSGSLVWTNNFVGSTPSGCNAATTVTFTVTDPCGNRNTTTAGFTVTSSTGPVLSKGASPISVDCTPGSNSAQTIQDWLNNNGGAVASDNCTGIVWTYEFEGAGTCTGAPVTFTACNLCVPALCVNTTTTATISDNAAPVFVKPPASPTVSCDAFAVQQFNTWLATAGGATVLDNCSPPQSVKLTNNWPIGKTLTSGCNNAATVSFFATDACGNVSPAQIATFRVVDNNPPSITPASDLTLDCDPSNINSFNSWLNINGGATASDICSNVTWTNNATKPFQNGCDVTQTVVFTASDSCGLTSNTTAAFRVFDNDPPRLITPASDLNTTCSSTVQSQVNAWLNNNGGAVAVDDCTPVTWTHNYDGLTGGCTLSAHVTFLVHDQCGFTTPTTATFAVIDNVAPVITTPAKSTTVNCDSNTESALEAFLNGHGGAVATDACQPASALTWTNNFATAPSQCGSIVVTFSVTDGCGRSASTTATFAVSDRSAPVIDPPGQSVSVECDGYGNTEQYNAWVSNNAGAAANDQCAINVRWTNTALPTGPFGCGSTAATFLVTDGCNNTAATSATFTVVDTIPPVIFPEAQDTIVQCDGQGNTNDLFLWLNSIGGASATDVCTGIVTLWTNEIVGYSSDDFSCTNFTTYLFTAYDLCGNTATTSATFGITDDGPPAITQLPSDLDIECGVSNTNQINSWLANAGGLVADDLCSEVVYSNNFEQQTNPGFGCFVLPVTFFASDACGHTVQADANLVLVDSKAPVFVNFPADITLPCDADTTPETTGLPAVSDACFSNLNSQITYNDTTTDLPANPDTPLCPGDHLIYRTFYVTDPCGNSAQQTQIITVEIARASGPCDASGCLCDNECCPEPTASDCVATDCLPQNCAPSYCESVPCSCGFDKRDVGEFAIEFPDSPIPQCEPIYIFVHDDDNEDDDDADDNSVSVVNKPMNFVMSDRPFTNEELERMKNLNHQKKVQQIQEVQVNTEEVKQAEGSFFQTIFNLF